MSNRECQEWIQTILETDWASEKLKNRGRELIKSKKESMKDILNYAMSCGIEIRNQVLKDMLEGK